MFVPIEKEEPMQILERIGPMVSLKSGDLNFNTQPRRSDLTLSSAPFWEVPNDFYFMKIFYWRLLSAQKNHFSVLGIKWATFLVTPIKNLPPPRPSPSKKRNPCNFWKGLVQQVSLKSGDFDFGIRQPRRSYLTLSGPHFGGSQTTFILFNFLIGGHLDSFWGVPNNFYFIQLFDWRPS